MQNTVMVAREATQLDAEIVRGRLEAEGIETFLRGAIAASTAGPINELNSSWSNPLGGVEVRVRREDETEALAVIAEIAARRRASRVKREWPNGLQILVGAVLSLLAYQTGMVFHPIVGYLAVVAVIIGTFVLARK